VDDPNVIFKRDDVRFGESLRRGKIGRRGFDGTKQVLGKTDARAPLEESRKWGIYNMTNLLFKTYFKVPEVDLACP
jgi:hypothetical protein